MFNYIVDRLYQTNTTLSGFTSFDLKTATTISNGAYLVFKGPIELNQTNYLIFSTVDGTLYLKDDENARQALAEKIETLLHP
jgi:hypothetical protein